MDFLPAWPLHFNELLLFSLLLAAGILGGHLAGRTRFVPRITGYIAAGFLLGPGLTGLLTPDLLEKARLFTDIALGLILYDLGRQLDIHRLRRDPWLLSTAALEAVLTFFLVFLALRLAGVTPLTAGLAAAIGISSSPAVILLVVRQLNARGPVTQNALNLVALNNVIAFFVYLIVLPLLHIEQRASAVTIILQPLYQLAVSLGIAWLIGWLMRWVARSVERKENIQFALTIGAIIGAIGLARMLKVSPVLALLSLGILVNLLDRESRLLPVEFGYGGELFFLILFVVAGANLHIEYLTTVGLLAVLFVLVRQAAKSLATFGIMRLAGMESRQAAMLGFTLMPMAGLAIGLSQLTTDLYPQVGRQLSTLVLATVAILETLGPIVTELALKKTGEVPAVSPLEH